MKNKVKTHFKNSKNLLIEESPFSIITLSMKGEVLYFNSISRDGILTFQNISCNLKNIVQPTLKLYKKSLVHPSKNKFYQFSKKMNKKCFKFQSLYDPLNSTIMIYGIDITNQKKVKNNLIKAKIHAENLASSKGQFLANMSHEIRTPLNGILGFVEILKKSNLNITQKEHIDIISRSGQVLLQIVNDILDISKIESGKLNVENSEFHLKRCIEDIIDVIAGPVYEKGLELPIYLDENIPKKLFGDEAKIRQVLINLIGNAVKFTPNGEISVYVKPILITNEGFCEIYFEVRDTGVGIPKKKLDSIFDIFEQADPSDTRNYGGTGLGLSISKELVNVMGGQLQVESKEAVGTKFFFTLKLKMPTYKEVSFSTRSFELKEEVKIIVLNQTIKTNILKRLDSWDIISSAENIKQLQNLSWKNNVKKNIILEHIYLESENVKEILKGHTFNDVHIMILTPSIEVEKTSYLLSDIPVDIISKPIKREDLFNSIKKKYKFSERKEKNHENNKKHKPKYLSGLSKKNTNSEKAILLVEDNLVNQKLAQIMLESHGYQVDVASNGQEALDQFNIKKHDLILMDCQMPIIDGFEATKSIKKIEPLIPIVAMTANAFKKTKEKCFSSGMDDFVTKPISDKDLVDVVRKYKAG